MTIEDINMRISILKDAYRRNMVDPYVYEIKMDDLLNRRKSLTQRKMEREQRMEHTIDWMRQMLAN
ncbi:hypothetical protein HUG15_09110 [Salicibibacter cibarius]|uniref:Uncharacterized protein n=1 Tax=Salicibibacter cibarius TaxID=2743000 RepID=A0A7T7CB98_9BACI|nr:hypothetical protein [Salicibibacter cibarius]QQK75707.1 hypothetical protein HUG15_09110 [Salicibibacter cibarius]